MTCVTKEVHYKSNPSCFLLGVKTVNGFCALTKKVPFNVMVIQCSHIASVILKIIFKYEKNIFSKSSRKFETVGNFYFFNLCTQNIMNR